MSARALDTQARRPAATTVVAGTCGAVGVAALLVATVVAPRDVIAGHVIEDTLATVTWATLGGVLAARAPRVVFGRVFLLAAAAAAIAVGGSALALVVDGDLRAVAAWVSGWAWIPATFLPVTVIPALFPDGTRPRRQPLVWMAAAAMTMMILGLATTSRIDISRSTDVANPLALPFSDGAFLAGSILAGVTAFTAIGALLRRVAGATGEKRRQLVPVAVAEVVTLPVLLAASFLETWGPALQLVSTPLVPGAVTLVILRRRLYDLELVVRRSVVFVGLSVLVVGGYVLIVQATANLLHQTAGLPESVVAAGVVALVFQPARSALQRLVARGVYGERDDPQRALRDIAGELTLAADPTSAVQAATERLRQALRVPWAEIDTDDRVVAEAGDRPGWAEDGLLLTAPLIHLGRACGILRVAPRGPGEPLSPRDHRLIDQLVPSVAAGVAIIRHVDDLQRSRERVVVAREEERRRLRRDLHDGVGPLLSALATHADIAALRTEDGRLGEQLDRIRTISSDAVVELRRAIEALQPVGIDELGLAGALRGLAAVLDRDGAAVHVDSTGDLDLPAAVELAVHHIAAEAMTNAVRHAGATHISVDLTAGPASVEVLVSDDGHGIGEDVHHGVGLASMRERAAELGGTLDVESGPGGTTITARLPRHDEDAA